MNTQTKETLAIAAKDLRKDIEEALIKYVEKAGIVPEIEIKIIAGLMTMENFVTLPSIISTEINLTIRM